MRENCIGGAELHRILRRRKVTKAALPPLPESIFIRATSGFRHDLPRDILVEEREHVGLVKLGRPAVGRVVVPRQ